MSMSAPAPAPAIVVIDSPTTDKSLPPTPSATSTLAATVADMLPTMPLTSAGPEGPPPPPPPASLKHTPLDAADLAATTIEKDAHDDARPADVEDLTAKGVKLNEHKHLIAGLRKDDVWTLIRRFDKTVQHVRLEPKLAPGRMDLNVSEDDEFAPDKLRANLERLYLTVILGMVAFGKHMTRLTSWHERNRTAAFCAAYYIAWFFNLLLPLIISLLLVLIVYPPARPYLFPPQPLVVVAHGSGNKPPPAAHNEGHSSDTLTGAPEAQKGEAAEKEASNFVGSLAMVAIGTATGTAGPSEKPKDHGDDEGSALPDPTELSVRAADAKATAEVGAKQHTKEDKTKQTMQNVAWEKAKPLMQALGQLADTWEKFGNALSPTPPFPRNRARMKLAAPLVPAILGIPFINVDMVVKSVGFFVGFGIFGQPLVTRGITLLNEKYPNWPEMLDLGGTLLNGVPTNAQLTLTLLRIAEAKKMPLPPPPTTAAAAGDAPPPAQGTEPNFTKDDDSGDDSSDESYVYDDGTLSDDEQPHPDGTDAATANADGTAKTAGAPKPSKHARAKARLARVLRGTAKLGAETAEVAHRAKAATTGGERAQAKVGVLPPTKTTRARGALVDGPDVFFARHRGKKGHLLLDTTGFGVCVRYVRGKTDEKTPTVEVPVADLVEMRKVGGLGWKGKMVAGWALGTDIPDGIEVTDRFGRRELFTAMPRRDELFDRLVAIGAQRWVSL